jgi:hypothetical protein
VEKKKARNRSKEEKYEELAILVRLVSSMKASVFSRGSIFHDSLVILQ